MRTTSAFRYRAASQDGVVEEGVVEARSRSDAVGLIGARGLFPVAVEQEAPSDGSRSMRASDLALGLRLLANLLQAGLPMNRTLAAFGDAAPAAWLGVLPVLREAVREGRGLTAGLADAPSGIPPVVLGIVRAGESGGGLAAAVARAADLMEARAATRSAILSAVAYPIVLAVAGTLSIALLVAVVLPRFASILSDLGQALPATTRLVLAAGSVARGAALPAAVTAAGITLLLRRWLDTQAGRARWDELLLRVPVVGPLRLTLATARAAAALSALLESGLPLLPSLLHASGAVGDGAVGGRLLRAREAVMAGSSLSAALSRQDAMTPTAVRLVRAGEETGRLAALLAHAARLEEARARETVARAVRLIEPASILLFGGLVALAAAALLQALYGMRPV